MSWTLKFDLLDDKYKFLTKFLKFSFKKSLMVYEDDHTQFF